MDNASTDGTAEFLAAEHPEATVVTTPENLGFAGGVQAGLDVVETPYAALLNNDAEADPGWLEALVGHSRRTRRPPRSPRRMVLADRPDVLNNTGVLLLPSGYGTDRGFGEPDGDLRRGRGGVRVLRRRRRAAHGRRPGGRRLPAPVLPLLRGHRPLVAAAAGRLDVRYEPRAVVRHQHSATVDQQSENFAFHNERNRLLTLLRCGPAGAALSAAGRFLLTTASLAARRAIGQRVPDVATFRPRLRLRAFGSFLRLVPWALRERRAIVGSARVTPREISARWTTAAD